MDNKKQSFSALSRIERATKLLICLVIFIIFNCGMVFGGTYTNVEIVDKALEDLGYLDYYLNKTYEGTFSQETYNTMTTYTNYGTYTDLREFLNQYDWVVFQANENWQTGGLGDSGAIAEIYCGYGENPYNTGFTQIVNKQIQRFFFTNASFNKALIRAENNYAKNNTTIGMTRENTEVWILNGEIVYSSNYEEPIPPMPYFEFKANKVGTTTLENVDGNINTYYITSFKPYVNSYTTNREIGYLYIPKPYDLDDLYMPRINIKKYNLQQTQNWSYVGYDFFIINETDDYLIYTITIQQDILTAPYFYILNFQSVTENYNDINIQFVLINSNNNSGIIIENNSGEQISGDEIKDETTLGDINNTLTEPYDPNKNILNNINSGDLLDNMGYQVTDDPNADLWDTIINGLKETLTGNGDVILELPLRSQTITINSKDIKQPESELKVFTSLFVNFWFLMQMFSFIKKTIDQINEGNLKVMHDVDADCYFF